MASLKDLFVNGVSRFVGKVYSAGGFVGNLTGLASKATADANGDTITSTYVKTSHVFTGTLAETTTSTDLPTASQVATFVKGKKSIKSIARTYTGAQGSNDIITVTYSDGTTSTYSAYHPKDGTSPTVVNNLTSTSTTDALSANQGKQLDTNKMNKNNPSGTGSFSLNRKADTTIGDYSFAEGDITTASGNHSHAEGYSTTASGVDSHAEGINTKASSANQHVQGKYNVEDSAGTYADIVGGGTSSARKNISALDWSGNLHLKGDVYIGCDDDSTGGTILRNTTKIAIGRPSTIQVGDIWVE